MLGPDPEKTIDEILLSSLGEATFHLECLLGKDWESWEWGRLHHVLLIHPLSAVASEEARGRLDVGPAPRGGSGDTVGNTAYEVEGFRQTGGSSFRIVVDVGSWDESLFMNSPGQSGEPQSTHYADLFEGWAADEAYPLLYDRGKIEAATGQRIVLEPKRR
jgi:penicillin amidase